MNLIISDTCSQYRVSSDITLSDIILKKNHKTIKYNKYYIFKLYLITIIDYFQKLIIFKFFWLLIFIHNFSFLSYWYHRSYRINHGWSHKSDPRSIQHQVYMYQRWYTILHLYHLSERSNILCTVLVSYQLTIPLSCYLSSR